MRMVIMCVAKITKLAWFDHPELQGTVTDLLNMGKLSATHQLVALQAMDDLIIEMGYWTKV